MTDEKYPGTVKNIGTMDDAPLTKIRRSVEYVRTEIKSGMTVPDLRVKTSIQVLCNAVEQLAEWLLSVDGELQEEKEEGLYADEANLEWVCDCGYRTPSDHMATRHSRDGGLEHICRKKPKQTSVGIGVNMTPPPWSCECGFKAESEQLARAHEAPGHTCFHTPSKGFFGHPITGGPGLRFQGDDSTSMHAGPPSVSFIGDNNAAPAEDFYRAQNKPQEIIGPEVKLATPNPQCPSSAPWRGSQPVSFTFQTDLNAEIGRLRHLLGEESTKRAEAEKTLEVWRIAKTLDDGRRIDLISGCAVPKTIPEQALVDAYEAQRLCVEIRSYLGVQSNREIIDALKVMNTSFWCAPCRTYHQRDQHKKL